MFVKICGTTSLADAALSARANALGVIVSHPASPRHVELDVARAIGAGTGVPVVAVSVNQSLRALEEIAAQLKPLALQLHGDETPDLVRELTARGHTVWKAIAGTNLLGDARVYTDAGARALVVDAREISHGRTVYGGTGHTADWRAARALVDAGFRVVLAGGLNPDNVAWAIETVRPWGVDVVSGVERAHGIKDRGRVPSFIENARTAANCLHL